jgi:hypothetical protein
MKRPFIVACLLLAAVATFAQRPGNRNNKNSAEGLPLSERVFFGGGGGFNSGVLGGYRYTYIAVNPMIGYRITMPFAAGVSINYQTYRFQGAPVAPINQYGASPFLQYRFGKLFAYGEFSLINGPSLDRLGRTTYKRLPLGLGFSQPIGPKAAINAMALYDVLYNRAVSPFPSPWILRVFISAGGISF